MVHSSSGLWRSQLGREVFGDREARYKAIDVLLRKKTSCIKIIVVWRSWKWLVKWRRARQAAIRRSPSYVAWKQSLLSLVPRNVIARFTPKEQPVDMRHLERVCNKIDMDHEVKPLRRGLLGKVELFTTIMWKSTSQDK
jgi:hypothetical protein